MDDKTLTKITASEVKVVSGPNGITVLPVLMLRREDGVGIARIVDMAAMDAMRDERILYAAVALVEITEQVAREKILGIQLGEEQV
jgi:hypothetical protein